MIDFTYDTFTNNTSGDTMKKQFRSLFLTLSLFGCMLSVSGCASAAGSFPPPASQNSSENTLNILTIGTADSGGTMYPVGSAIAEVISSHDSQIKINLSASGGSFDNVEGIAGGQTDLGLVSGDVAYAAYTGTNDFKDHPVTELRAIGAVYSSISNWMAPAEKHVSFVHDLTGLRIAIGPEGSTTEYSARIALDASGITPDNSTLINYGIGSGSENVANGQLDAIHGFAGIPIGGLTKLAESIPCRLLQYTPDELSRILDSNSFYYRAVIPSGTYPGQNNEVETFGIKCLLCVNESMDEDLVYTLTKILHESVPQLTQSHPALAVLNEDGYICCDLPIPLHKGAKRYYTETGCLEP